MIALWFMLSSFIVFQTIDKATQLENKKEMNEAFKEQYHKPRLKDLDNMKKYRRQ